MAKGPRGGKRNSSSVNSGYATPEERTTFVWEMAEKRNGIRNPIDNKTLNTFLKNYSGESRDGLIGDIDSATTEIEIARRRFPNTPLYINRPIPDGYMEVQGATTAPNGFRWYYNGQSRFSGERRAILATIPDYWEDLYLPF